MQKHFVMALSITLTQNPRTQNGSKKTAAANYFSESVGVIGSATERSGIFVAPTLSFTQTDVIELLDRSCCRKMKSFEFLIFLV
jgi:hypothetical protein